MHHSPPTPPGIRYRSDHFSTAEPGLHHYALVMHATEYVLVIAHKESGRIELAFRTAENTGKELCQELLTKEMPYWKAVNLPAIQGQVLHTGGRFTLVPRHLNENELTPAVFGLNHHPDPNETLHTAKIEGQEMDLVFSMDSEVQNLLSNLLPLSDQRHIGASLLHQPALLCNNTSAESFTAIYATGHSLVVHVSTQGRTTMLNSFPYTSQSDLMYFLAALAAHPELNGVNYPMVIMGGVDDLDEALIEQMKGYIPHLTFANSHHAGSVLPEKERPGFHLLLHQLSCVS